MYNVDMQMRLFLGISIPDDIKKRLFRFVEKEYRQVPLVLRDKENYHLTLIFFGFVQEDGIPQICSGVQKVTDSQEAFELEFSKIEAGPSQTSKRLVWATGPADSQLTKLKNNLSKSLGSGGSGIKLLVPHITLARIKKSQLPKDASQINWERNISFSIPVQSVELFESKFEKGKRIYYIMESFPLQ